MKNIARHPPEFKGYPSYRSWLLVNFILLGGIALPPLLGLVAIAVLQSRGVQTDGLVNGFFLLIPIMFLTEIPYALLALIVSKVLKSSTPGEPPSLTALMSVSVGAVLGLSAALGYLILSAFLSERGLGEVVGMMAALWMLTLPAFLVVGAVGVIVGSAAGAVFSISILPLLSRN